jgi:hypothetical protein
MSVRALKGEAWYLLMTAATDEAERAGHREVDVDHVLLGLLVTGGPSTELLSRAGIDLAAARTALAEVRGEGPTPVPVPRSGRTSGAGTSTLPWSDRARRALASLPGAAPDTEVLEALLADETGSARRLLARAGIDADALRAGSGAAVAAPDAPTAISRTWTSSHSRTVAVPRAELWRLLADPHRRRQWDDSVVQVRVLDDGAFETLDTVAVTLARPGAAVEEPGLVSTHRVVDRVEGCRVEWETRYPNRGHTEWLRVELEDAGPGTQLTIRHAFSRTGGLRRPLSGVYAWTTRLRLKLLAQAIAQAASGG